LVFSKVAKNVQLQVVVPAKEAFLWVEAHVPHAFLLSQDASTVRHQQFA
jgi:hypothetical protein